MPDTFVINRQNDDSLTNVSLILRVGTMPADDRAWHEFVDRYGPKILGWTRGWGLQQADAEDVTQTVLVKLAGAMNRFAYDNSGSFRGWLRTIARNAWLDWVAEKSRTVQGVIDTGPDSVLSSIEAREDLIRRLEETFDLELLVEAVHRIRLRVAPKTWDAYRLTAMDQQPVREVAETLGMTIASVFKAKSNVLKLIRQEVSRLSASSPPTS